MIRRTTTADASGIAEILIFTKRINYRKIVQFAVEEMNKIRKELFVIDTAPCYYIA